MVKSETRYEVVLIDGEYFVFDRQNPDAKPYKATGEQDAWIAADFWNILGGYKRQSQ